MAHRAAHRGTQTTLAGLLAATTRMPTQAEADRLTAELRGIDEGCGSRSSAAHGFRSDRS